MDPIRRLRQQVRSHTRGEKAGPDEEALLADLAAAVAAGAPHPVAVAFHRLDAYRAAHEEGEPVTDDELAVLREVLGLADAAAGDVLAHALALPSAHDALAVRLLVGQLRRDPGDPRAGAAVAKALPLAREVAHPHARWRLRRALAELTGDAEEAARADEAWRGTAALQLSADAAGTFYVGGLPADQPGRVPVAPGPHVVALSTGSSTHLQVIDVAPREVRRVHLVTRRLAPGFDPIVPDLDPLTAMPLRIVSAVDGAEMLYVPPGRFTMGVELAAADPALATLTGPLRKAVLAPREVEMRGFYVDARPVSNDVFSRFLQRGGYAKPAYWSPAGWAAHHGPGREDRAGWEGWLHSQGRKAALRQPVTNVTWFEAAACARWAHKALPTEAQCERAVLYHGVRALGLLYGEWCADSYREPEDGSAGPTANPFQRGQPEDAKVVRALQVTYYEDAVTARLRGQAPPAERRWRVGFRTVWVPEA